MSKDSVVIFRTSTAEKRLLKELAKRQGTTVSGVLRGFVNMAAGGGQAPQVATGK